MRRWSGRPHAVGPGRAEPKPGPPSSQSASEAQLHVSAQMGAEEAVASAGRSRRQSHSRSRRRSLLDRAEIDTAYRPPRECRNFNPTCMYIGVSYIVLSSPLSRVCVLSQASPLDSATKLRDTPRACSSTGALRGSVRPAPAAHPPAIPRWCWALGHTTEPQCHTRITVGARCTVHCECTVPYTVLGFQRLARYLGVV